MSNLPGNPFAEGPDNFRETLHNMGKSHLAYEISATLALAYEQRTATLVLIAASTAPEGTYALDPELVHAAQSQLAERLGLGGDND